MPDPGLLTEDLSDDEKRKIAMQSLFSGLLQGGLSAVAAGGRMTDAQRAPLLMQAGAAYGGIAGNASTMTKQAAQEKLLGVQTAQAKAKIKQQQEYEAMLQTPEFQAQFDNLPPEQKAVVQMAIKSRDPKAVEVALKNLEPRSFGTNGIYDPRSGTITHVDPVWGNSVMSANGQPVGQPQQAMSPQQSTLMRPPVAAATPQPQGTPAQGDSVNGQGVTQVGDLFTNDPNINMDVYNSLPDSVKPTIKAIIQGRFQMTGQMMRSEAGRKYLEAANAVDPTLDASNYAARAATAKAFAAGKPAEQITALNTAIQHMGELHKAANELNNTSVPLYNSAENYVQNKVLGDKRPTNFMMAAHPVAEELSRVFKGSNMSDAEVKQWQQSLSPDMSPDQIQGAMGIAQKLMDGRINALQDQYKRGTNREAPSFLTPKSRETLDYINNNPVGKPQPKAAMPAQGDAPQPPMQGARQAPDGKWYVPDPNRPGKYQLVQ